MTALTWLRTLGGLGGPPTASQLSSRLPFVTHDTAYCVRVDQVGDTAAIRYQIVVLPDSAALTAWTATDQHIGDPQPLDLDETATLTAGPHAVMVTRVGDGAGVLDVRPVLVQNNDVAGDDAVDPDDLTTYRCIVLAAEEGLIVDSVTGVGVQVALDAPGDPVEISLETEPPPGMMFEESLAPALALEPAEYVGLWLKRPTYEVAGEHVVSVEIVFTVGDDQHTLLLTGAYVTIQTDLSPFLLYYAVGGPGLGDPAMTVDDTVLPPVPVAALPHAWDVAAIQQHYHGLGHDDIVIRAGLRSRTHAGAESQNQLLDIVIALNWLLGDVTLPNAPQITDFEVAYEGHALASVSFDQEGALSHARYLVGRITVQGAVETILAELPSDQDQHQVSFVFQDRVPWGAVVTLDVWAEDWEGRAGPVVSDSLTALWLAGTAAPGVVMPGARTGAAPSLASQRWGSFTTTWAPGVTEWRFGHTRLLTALSGPPWARPQGIMLRDLALVDQDMAGPGVAGPVEVVGATVYLCACGQRVAALDTAAMTLACNVFGDSEPPSDCPAAEVAETDGVTYWQLYDVGLSRWITWLAVDANHNRLLFGLPLKG